MTVMEEATEDAPIEDDAIWRWRLDEFFRLGFNLRQRLVLADRGVSPHDAEILIAKGCPVDVAFDILS